jgi:hypothetical protein
MITARTFAGIAFVWRMDTTLKIVDKNKGAGTSRRHLWCFAGAGPLVGYAFTKLRYDRGQVTGTHAQARPEPALKSAGIRNRQNVASDRPVRRASPIPRARPPAALFPRLRILLGEHGRARACGSRPDGADGVRQAGPVARGSIGLISGGGTGVAVPIRDGVEEPCRAGRGAVSHDPGTCWLTFRRRVQVVAPSPAPGGAGTGHTYPVLPVCVSASPRAMKPASRGLTMLCASTRRFRSRASRPVQRRELHKGSVAYGRQAVLQAVPSIEILLLDDPQRLSVPVDPFASAALA